MIQYKVEKNVPPPVDLWPRGRKRVYPFADMLPGDSFVADSRNAMAAAYAWGRVHGGTFTGRLLEDGNYRIWRLK